MTFVNTALSNYALAVAYLIIAMLSPLLTSMADHKGNKKIYMQLFTWIGALSCWCLYFFKLDTLELGIICFALAAIGYGGGLVFYNSYLPEIASADQQDAVSAKGFSYGYIGSVILQLICFVFVLKPEWFGITDLSFPPRLSFLLVGLWWIGFAQIPFRVLPKGSPNFNAAEQKKITSGFVELQKVWKQIRTMALTEEIFNWLLLLFNGCTNDYAGGGWFWRKNIEFRNCKFNCCHPDYSAGSHCRCHT